MDGRAAWPVGGFPACTFTSPTPSVCEFSSVILVFLDVRRGTCAIYFGPGDLPDRTTITRIHALISALLVVLLASVLEAAPAFANNTFPGTVIAGSNGTFTGTNVGATGEAGEPATFGGGSLNTMWYSWTAPAAGVVVIGTCNPTASTTTNFDTTLGVYTGAAVNALTVVGTNDDTTGCNSTVNANYGSTVSFTAVSGTTYRFQVDGYASNTGTFHLHYGLVGFVFATTDGSATEGGDTGAFTVRLTTVPTANASVTIGTSTQCTFAPSPLTFTLANWNTAQTVTATATNDAIVEGVHSCTPASVTATGGSFGTAIGTAPTITVNDNDSATVTIANTTNGAEAGPVNGVMTVTQTAVSATNTVIAYSVAGTATSGTDYTALSGTVTVLAGATTATIPITVTNDAIVEGSETVIVTLTSITSGLATLGATLTATNTIADNDSATVTIANTTNGAEAGPVNGVMTVTQTAVSATNTVIAYSVAGTATSGTDYTALSGTVTILAGATTATIPISVTNDAIVETSETVIVTLTSITSGLATLGATLTATNTIADNDSATVTIANTTNGAELGPVNGVMTVTQTAVSATNTVIAYSVAGTATSGTDYTALSGTVTVIAGATTATIAIPVINDVLLEGPETVIVTLTSITSGLATLGGTLSATNTIADNTSATVSIANTTNGSETGPANGVMTVTQTAISATDTVIAYSVAGTATSGTDYTALSGTVTIIAGATTATIPIPVINDPVVEGSETVIVTLTSITSGLPTLGVTLTATNTIADNDSATVTIATTTNGAEAGPVDGVMTVTQTAVSATDTVLTYSVAGTATSGTDYTALSGTVTVLAGATTATITIPVTNDAIVENPETVIVTLTSVTSGLATLGGTLAATNTIADNDSATVSIANTTEGEETPVNGVMTLTQTAVSATDTVITYSVAGTATPGTDYTALSGTVTIPAGATTATITIPVIDDFIVEGDETVIVTLTSITSGLATLGVTFVATNLIDDNEPAIVTIANTTEGDEGGPINGVMTVSQTAVSATDSTIAYTVGGSASPGPDYTALSGSVTILAGDMSATIIIPVIDDLILEGDETVVVTITAVTSGLAILGATLTATNTIEDNEPAIVTIANTSDGAEPATGGIMTVSQTAVSATDSTIAYTVAGTALPGTDYTALSGSVTILAGDMAATIPIPVTDDAIVENPETVIVTLTSVTAGLAILGATLTATNTIADNDVATVTIANTSNGAEPATGGVMTVTQTAVSAEDTVIAYGVAGTATPGTDYTALSGTVTIIAGATTAIISIPVTDDAIVEAPETVIVTLGSITSGLATLGGTLTATNTIADNDSATVTIANTTNGAEPATNGVMTLTQTAVSAEDTVIAYGIAGTATSGTDYSALSGTVTVLAGDTTATVTIPVIDDLILDPAETVIVTLSSVSSGLASLGATLTATNTIADNDIASFTILKAVNVGNISLPATLTYTITVANTGNIPLTAPSFSDALAQGGALTLTSGPALSSGDAVPLGTFNVAETWVYTATYAATQANIDNGANITNSATFDTAETSPLASNTTTTTITQSPALEMKKTADTAGPVSAADIINYSYETDNIGNITILGVTVNDTFNGYGIAPVPGSEALTLDVAPFGDSSDGTPADGIWDVLAPGDEVTFIAAYTVVQQDVDLLQ